MEQLTALTLEELQKRQAKYKSLLIALIVVFGLLVCVHIGLYLYSGKLSFGALIPMIVLPITWLPMLQSLKAVKEEISSREANG